ncbi:MAG: hypothetical protein C4525_12335 [Desulfarculus sp.]|jgi:hypothetical protein|nr:MAG: hypothetical protein C4525_12335 [Desulfarculus sp.]
MFVRITGVILFFVGLALLPLGARAESAAPAKSKDEQTQKYIKQLEKRVSDLEAIVVKLLKEKAPAGTVSAPEKEPANGPAKTLKGTAEPASEAGDWDEPSIKKSAGGRDEDARRRVSELETWRKKLEAKITKKEEEETSKVKFDFSGKYKLRLNVKDNINLNNPKQFWTYDDTTYFDQRFQLKIEATYGALSAVFMLDKGNFVFDWKEDSQGTLDRWGEFFTTEAAWVRELYGQYTGAFVFKAGRQNITDPNKGMVLEGPSDALRLIYPFGNTAVGRVTGSLSYIAVSGGFKDYKAFIDSGGPPAGDRRAVFGVDNKLDAWYLDFKIKPAKFIDIGLYVLKVFDKGHFGDPDLNLDKDFNTLTLPRDGHFEPMWIGVALSGKRGDFSYEADLIYLGGTYSQDRDLDAHAILLRGDYNLKKFGRFRNFQLGLEFARGSGNEAEDSTTQGTMKEFNGLWLCKERRKYGDIFSEDLRAGYFLWDSNISNVTLLRGIASFEPIPDLKATLSILRLWTTESVFKGHGPVRDWSAGQTVTTEKTNDIGWEIDLNFDFPIQKRLRGFIEFGYFIPGDVYARSDGQSANPASKIVIGAELAF